MKYKIRIPTHRDNFWFCTGWTSPDAKITMRKSCQQLNGIYAPQVFWFEYKNLSQGTYIGFVDLYRVPHHVAGRASHNFVVLDDERPDCPTPTSCRS